LQASSTLAVERCADFVRRRPRLQICTGTETRSVFHALRVDLCNHGPPAEPHRAGRLAFFSSSVVFPNGINSSAHSMAMTRSPSGISTDRSPRFRVESVSSGERFGFLASCENLRRILPLILRPSTRKRDVSERLWRLTVSLGAFVVQIQLSSNVS